MLRGTPQTLWTKSQSEIFLVLQRGRLSRTNTPFPQGNQGNGEGWKGHRNQMQCVHLVWTQTKHPNVRKVY